MKRARAQHWLALFTWLVLACLLQGRMAGNWVPELCLVVTVCLAARMEEREALFAALLAALVRASFSGDGLVIAAAGMLGAVLLVLVVRAFLEVSAPLYASLLVFVAVITTDGFYWLAAQVRAYWAQQASIPPPGAMALAQVALSSALLAMVACWLVPRLPGLSALVSRKW